jgi:hypothetical protein
LKIYDSNYCKMNDKVDDKIDNKMNWRYMIQIIEDEWFKLLKMNNSNYWRYVIQIICEDE